MLWKDHSKDPHRGAHAFLAPSNGSWEGYDDKELLEKYVSSSAKEAGTVIHEFACKRIKRNMLLGEKDIDSMIFYMVDHWIPKHVIYSMDIAVIFETVRKYVNDAILLGLDPERELYYNEDAYGTSDAISFNDILRIHDLKTGQKPATFKQLEKYAALYCLDYEVDPETIDIELRLYQLNDIQISRPDASVIRHHMDEYIHKSQAIYDFRRSFA